MSNRYECLPIEEDSTTTQRNNAYNILSDKNLIKSDFVLSILSKTFLTESFLIFLSQYFYFQSRHRDIQPMYI